jgi:cytochrome c biogenesis protein CcmG, thiol:disulfide interchange protein DsbE
VPGQIRPGKRTDQTDGGAAAEPAGTRRRPAVRSRARLAIAAAGLLGAGVLIGLAASSQGAKTPARPQPAKDFSVPALGQPGHTISLAALAGQPVIVNFFASWCGPCKRETPLLASFYRSHHGKILVIGVDANDETGPALKFIKAQGVRYPVASDPYPAKVAVSYGVLELPQSFFLNSRHLIVKHVVGGLTPAELRAWAASLAGHGQG